MTAPDAFEVSQIRLYLECPQKWGYVYLDNRVGPPSVALTTGALWHNAMERRLGGEEPDAAFTAALSESTAQVKHLTDPTALYNSGKAAGEFCNLHPAFMLWQPKPDWEILHIEKEFSAPLPYASPTRLRGRVDCLVKWNGFYWHLQHKTLAPSRPLRAFIRYMERDWHECAYQWLLEQHGYQPYGGTLLNIVRKLSKAKLAENPAAALHIEYIVRPPYLVTKAIEDIDATVQRMQLERVLHAAAMAQKGFSVTLLQNRSMCGGIYGNSLCPYIDVCNGRATTADPPFTDRKDPYQES